MTDLSVDKLTPPPELVEEWCQQGRNCISELDALKELATQAARWGADQELEACCRWADVTGWVGAGSALRRFRRPKPPSLKEQALRLVFDYGAPFYKYTAEQTDIIRRALEALPND
jgi:hypothetical protein